MARQSQPGTDRAARLIQDGVALVVLTLFIAAIVLSAAHLGEAIAHWRLG